MLSKCQLALHQGEYLQLIVGSLLAGVILALISWLRPYAQQSSNYLATTCQLVLLGNLQIAMLLKGYKADEQLEVERASSRAFNTTDVVSDTQAARDEHEQQSIKC